MIPGETIATGASQHCSMCEKKLELKVLSTPAGYYVGTFCCEPHSRESGYYPTREKAQEALDSGEFGR